MNETCQSQLAANISLSRDNAVIWTEFEKKKPIDSVEPRDQTSHSKKRCILAKLNKTLISLATWPVYGMIFSFIQVTRCNVNNGMDFIMALCIFMTFEGFQLLIAYPRKQNISEQVQPIMSMLQRAHFFTFVGITLGSLLILLVIILDKIDYQVIAIAIFTFAIAMLTLCASIREYKKETWMYGYDSSLIQVSLICQISGVIFIISGCFGREMMVLVGCFLFLYTTLQVRFSYFYKISVDGTTSILTSKSTRVFLKKWFECSLLIICLIWTLVILASQMMEEDTFLCQNKFFAFLITFFTLMVLALVLRVSYMYYVSKQGNCDQGDIYYTKF